MCEQPSVVLQTGGVDHWISFGAPHEHLVAHRIEDVLPTLEAASAAADRGRIAVGFLSYEAAPAFDSALTTCRPGDLPLAWFAVFDPAEGRTHPSFPLVTPGPVPELPAWRTTASRSDHREAIERIHRWIAAGETYQVNYTFRLETELTSDAAVYFAHLASRHQAGYAAWIDTGRHAVGSLSPELFFQLDGNRLTARPMKGTAPRGHNAIADELAARDLASSAKDRAENIMIVDMVRNDVGRIARPGSVVVSSLCEVERYPTVLQMVSTCEAATDAGVPEIMRALFPSASITGAPKVRTMELIARLEDRPRGIYTGAIGSIGPGRQARFNVAIRTLQIDRELGTAEYGTGGGIVWESDADSEYEEAMAKTRVVYDPEPEFDLLETIRWHPQNGFHLLDRHLDRLRGAAAYFGRPLDEALIERQLSDAIQAATRPQRVRLLVGRHGSVRVEIADLEPMLEPRRVRLASSPVQPDDPFLCHKTTHRQIYHAALAAAPDADDVLLWNTRGELTESAVANLILDLGGELLTPPLSSGLLPGVARAELIDSGEVHERILTLEDLSRADRFYLINGVQGRLRAELMEEPGEGETPSHEST